MSTHPTHMDANTLHLGSLGWKAHLWKVRTLALGMAQLRSKSTVEVGSPSFSQSKATPKGKMSTTSKSRTLQNNRTHTSAQADVQYLDLLGHCRTATYQELF